MKPSVSAVRNAPNRDGRHEWPLFLVLIAASALTWAAFMAIHGLS
jgi:hypothetical protein